MYNNFLLSLPIFFLLAASSYSTAQNVEILGELKVSQMNENQQQNNLVVHNTDGSLGIRSVASLPSPPPPYDTTRNLASDFELAQYLCNCPNMPSFMISRLLGSGYTRSDLLGAGIPIEDLYNADRYETLLDVRDGQKYSTIRIGKQRWMAQNLNIGIRIDGSINQIDNGVLEKYCYDDQTVNCDEYGGLYQWDELMNYSTTEGAQGICPTGWHIPTDEDFMILEEYLNMCTGAASGCSEDSGYRGTNQGSILSGNKVLWDSGLLEQDLAFGSSGLDGLPGGARLNTVTYYGVSKTNYIWTSSEGGSGSWYRILINDDTKVGRFTTTKTHGFSVRCVKD